MNAKMTFIIMVLLLSIKLAAQENNIQDKLSINADGAATNPSSILDVSSDAKGILIPRMTTTERDNINDPATGLIIYDTDIKSICHYNGSQWDCLLGTSIPLDCETLDEAYDCGGSGIGRKITVDNGAVELDGDLPVNPVLVVKNRDGGPVASFEDYPLLFGQLPEATVTICEDQGDAVYATTIGLGKAGFFETTNVMNTNFSALEGYNHGPNTGVFGHTGVKVPINGTFVLASQPVSGVLGVSSSPAERKGVTGISLGSDGTFGKTYTNGKLNTVSNPNEIIAGVHGTAESPQTTNSFDFVGVVGATKGNGIGVIGSPGTTNSRGHGVMGVSGGYESTNSTNIGVWGITREGKNWDSLMTFFPYEDIANNKLMVGVMGQSEKYVGVWGESRKNVGVIGTTYRQGTNAEFSSEVAGVVGLADTLGIGVVGRSKSNSNTHTGIKAHGKADREKASALHIHDGDIRVTKANATDTPADKIELAFDGWAPVPTCPEDPGPHEHIQAYVSSPVTISNQYADAVRSIIMVTVETEDPGISVQLYNVNDDSFEVQLTIHTANMYCSNNPPSIPAKIHYMIINK